MGHVLAMHILYRLYNLLEDAPYLSLVAEPAPMPVPDVLVQVVTVDVLDYDRYLIPLVYRVMELHDAYMVQL